MWSRLPGRSADTDVAEFPRFRCRARDWIEVGGFSGYVRGINVRSTEIETFDRASVILPNSDLVAGTVLNRTHSGMSGRLQVPVSVTYDADPQAGGAILLEIAESHPLVLEDPAPRVLFLGLGRRFAWTSSSAAGSAT